MNDNKWRKIRQIRIKPVSIIISIIVLLVFFALTASGNEKKTEAEIITETVYSPAASAYSMPTAGITKELTQAADIRTAPEPEKEPAEAAAVGEEPETFNQNIPVSEQYQEWFIKYSIMYDCPLSFAYATADVETEFDMTAIGAAGEVGIMQIYPGKNGRYFTEYECQIGLNPASEEGNIACGCYLLGNYLNTYGDIERAAMAYNLGISGAINLWEQGICSTKYSRKVKAAYEKWCAVLSDGA